MGACRTQIINCLVEGNSIRSTERMTNTHRDTIMRLLVQVGDGCAKIMDEKMRDLDCKRVQVDEIWSYVGKKQAQLKPGESVRAGDFWTFVALGRRYEDRSVLPRREAYQDECYYVHVGPVRTPYQSRSDFI